MMSASATVRARILIFGALAKNFSRALEAGKGFGHLRSDRDHLNIGATRNPRNSV